MTRFVTGLGWYVVGGVAWAAGMAYIAVVTVKDALRVEID